MKIVFLESLTLLLIRDFSVKRRINSLRNEKDVSGVYQELCHQKNTALTLYTKYGIF
jgi:hypothetical protein